MITSGNLTLILDEDENNLQIENALPLYDEVGMIQEPFTFRVINQSTTSVNYVLRLVDITTGERLSKDIVKYGLEKNGEPQIGYLSTLHNGVISSGNIKSKEEIQYALRLWIDSSVEDENLIKNKKLSYLVELVYGQMLVDGDFQYGIESSQLTDKQIEIKPYTSEQVDLILTSLNSIDTGYELYYKIVSPENVVDVIDAGYLKNSESVSNGIISKEEVKNISLMFNNTGSESVVLEIGIKANLVQNELVLESGENSLKKETIQKYYVYDYTGDYQTFTASKTGVYKIELWGAGMNAALNGQYINNLGAYTSGNIVLDAKEKLYVYVGQLSQYCKPYTQCSSAWNGGGEGGYFLQSDHPARIPGGSGATDIRVTSGEWNDSASLSSRIMVAGGAGNGYIGNSSAGGLIGYTSLDYNNGSGGTQVSGGNSSSEPGGFGYGGKGTITDLYHANCNDGMGGGGGYYGGGGGRGGTAITDPGNHRGSGGGGSSFISGHAGCIAIISEDDQTPKVSEYSKIEDSYHYSGKIFTDTVMIDGRGYYWSTEILEKVDMPTHDLTSTMVGNSGNGHARITYLGE